jgi:NAD(P)-dependent dehydrogenase (short-subunit alcohol dehydrogenase family)
MKILITGATRGIGRAAAVELAKQGHDLVLIGRDPARAQDMVEALKGANEKVRVEVMMCDLSSQADIRRLAGEIKQQHPAIDVLINNAGGMFVKRQLTVDKLEWTFAVNHLGYFLLTNLLADVITQRVVSTSSGAHMNAKLDFDDLQFEKRSYSPMGFPAYMQSKLCNILFTRELARREKKFTANCYHPGFVHSHFGHEGSKLLSFGLALTRPFQRSVEKGADTLVYLATSPEVSSVSGEYFFDRKIKKGSSDSRDESYAKKLWEISEKMTGLA